MCMGADDTVYIVFRTDTPTSLLLRESTIDHLFGVSDSLSGAKDIIDNLLGNIKTFSKFTIVEVPKNTILNFSNMTVKRL